MYFNQIPQRYAQIKISDPVVVKVPKAGQTITMTAFVAFCQEQHAGESIKVQLAVIMGDRAALVREAQAAGTTSNRIIHQLNKVSCPRQDVKEIVAFFAEQPLLAPFRRLIQHCLATDTLGIDIRLKSSRFDSLNSLPMPSLEWTQVEGVQLGSHKYGQTSLGNTVYRPVLTKDGTDIGFAFDEALKQTHYLHSDVFLESPDAPVLLQKLLPDAVVLGAPQWLPLVDLQGITPQGLRTVADALMVDSISKQQIQDPGAITRLERHRRTKYLPMIAAGMGISFPGSDILAEEYRATQGVSTPTKNTAMPATGLESGAVELVFER